MNWQAGPNKLTLDLKNYAAGSYYLMIRKPNAQGIVDNFSYKIQKQINQPILFIQKQYSNEI